MTRLALCIPAYNAARFLPALLDSARRQEVLFDEVLVYNDCSTDDTAAVARAHGATVVEGDVNRGCSVAKNRLAAATTCEWIHFHDADDLLLPNFTRLAHRWMSEPDAPDVVLFDYEYRDYATGELLLHRRFDDALLREDALAYAIAEQINPFCGLYNRAAYLRAGGYDEDPAVLYNEDVAMHIRLATAGLRFRVESEVSIINYRVTGSMSGANAAKCIRAHLEVMRRTAERVDRRYHSIIASKLWLAAGVAATFSDWGTARTCVEMARRLGAPTPRDGSELFRLLASVSPYGAVRVREWAIRAFKPHLRAQ